MWASATREDELRAALALAPGAVFTQAGYDAGRAALYRHYAELGFAYVRVDKAATVDVDTHAARITYTIDRGPPAVLGTTSVTGLDRVQEEIVLRELGYAEGESYDPRRLEESHARIFGLRLFRVVTVKPANLDERSGVVDVVVSVTEGAPRELRAGVGYGTEDGPRGQLRWQHFNFFGGGRQLGFQLRASEITQEFGAEFRQPYFLHPKQTLIVPLTQGRADEPGYTNASISLVPRIERTLTAHLRVGLGFGAEYDDVTDIPDATRSRLEEFRSSGYVFGPRLWVEHRTTDDLINPRRGHAMRFTFEQAGGPWQGGYTFARGSVDVRRYFALGASASLASRVRIGLGDGFGDSSDLPVFRRFYAGGIDSTRGYRRHRVGPLNEFGDPVGGRSLLEGESRGAGADSWCAWRCDVRRWPATCDGSRSASRWPISNTVLVRAFAIRPRSDPCGSISPFPSIRRMTSRIGGCISALGTRSDGGADTTTAHWPARDLLDGGDARGDRARGGRARDGRASDERWAGLGCVARCRGCLLTPCADGCRWKRSREVSSGTCSYGVSGFTTCMTTALWRWRGSRHATSCGRCW